MKKVLCLLFFLILLNSIPILVFAQNEQALLLSQKEAKGILNAIQLSTSQRLSTGGILDFSGKEQSALSLFRSAIRKDIFNFLPQFATVETIKLAIKTSNFITKFPETTIKDFLEELEKQTIAEANKRALDWLFDENIKTGSGEINTTYNSYKGKGQGKAYVQYLLTFRELKDRQSEVVLEFRSPESTDAYGAISSIGHSVGFLGDSPIQGQITPFVIRIKTNMEKINFDWKIPISAEMVILVEFPDEVPKLALSKALPYPLEEQKIKLGNYWIMAGRVINFLKESGNERIEEIGETASDAYKVFGGFIELLAKFASLGSGNIEQYLSQDAKLQKEVVKIEEEKPIELALNEVKEVIKDENIVKTREELSLVEILKRLEEIKLEARRIENEINIAKEKENEKDESIQICSANQNSIPQQNPIILNEIAWMGTLNSANDEWIELKNISNHEVSIENWQLIDKGNQIHIIFEKDHIIPSDSFFILERTDDTSLPSISADIIYKGSLSNKNESLYLFDENCVLIDKVISESKWPAGDNSKKLTMERKTNLNWQTSNVPGGTPNQNNSGGIKATYNNAAYTTSSSTSYVSKAYQKLLITEIQALPTGERFVELYNPNDQTISLTDWYIQRKTESGNTSSFVSSTNFEGLSINGKSYFLIAREEASFLNNVDILSNITITEHNTIILKNPNREIVDKVGFGSNSPDFEGAATIYPEIYKSISRTWDDANQSYNDTDNNFNDFKIQIPTPKSKNIWQNSKSKENISTPIVSFDLLELIQPNTIFNLSWSTVTPTNIDTFSLTYAVTPSVDGIFLRYKNNDDWIDWDQNTIASFNSNIDTVSLSSQDGIAYNFSITATDTNNNSSDPDTISTKVRLNKSVVINEIAWMGTNASTSDEWIELYNTTDSPLDLTGWKLKSQDGTPNIELSGEISSNGYFLLERTNDNTISDITADIIYTGALGNNGEILQLLNENDQLIDEIYALPSWISGDNTRKQSMERIIPLDSSSSAYNWSNNNLIFHNGKDADGSFINGTPGQKNSASTQNAEVLSLRLDEFDDIALTSLSSPYIVNKILEVPTSKTLIINPGVTIKFGTNGGFAINGTLKSIGQENKQILFTSSLSSNYWNGIYLKDDLDSEIEWSKFQYGNRSISEPQSILIENSSPIIKNSIIENYDCNNCRGITLINSNAIIDNTTFNGGSLESNFGIDISFGNPTIKNSYFENHKYGIFINLLNPIDLPIIEDNEFQSNEAPIYSNAPNFITKNNFGSSTIISGIILKGSLSQNLTWFKNDFPYVIEQVTDLTIQPTTTLTIQKGITIKMKNGTSINVNGTLIANGTSQAPIILTSINDCEITSCPGSWKSISFSESSTDSILKYINVNFGGNGNTGSIKINGSDVQIDNISSQYSSESSLYIQNSNSIIQNSSFGNSLFGVKIYGTSYPQLDNLSFENNFIKDIFIDDCDFLPLHPSNFKTNCP